MESSIVINFKFVCNTCSHRESYLDEMTTEPVGLVSTKVGCIHEKVCKAYLDLDGVVLDKNGRPLDDYTDEEILAISPSEKRLGREWAYIQKRKENM